MDKRLQWSYSKLTSFEDCPRRFYYTTLTKEVQEKQSEQMLWGNKVHKALEHRILGKAALPHDLLEYEPLAASVVNRATGGQLLAEKKMAVNKNYEPVTYFAEDVWARGITDFTVIKGSKAFIGDWKTGKPTPASAQLKLTAAMTFQHVPYIDTVITSFVWLKTGGITAETYSREDIPDLWNEFHPRVARMEHAILENKFPPKPSGLCRQYCPVGKARCEHCGS